MNIQKDSQLNIDDAEKQLKNNIDTDDQIKEKKKKQIIYFFIIIFVFLGVISVIIFNFYANKNKYEK